MKKGIYLLVIGILLPIFTSCSSYSKISNGAYSDVSLNRNSDEYELKRLNDINAEGKALFGIPRKADKKKGVIFRFNGLEFGKTSQAMPIISLIIYTLGSGYMINEIAGINDDGSDVLGLGPSMIIGVPLAGILNNASWSGAALRNASWNINSQLLDENPNVDVFLNPKYEIEYTQGLFTQKAKVKLRVMGATLLTD